MLCKAHRGLYL